MKKKLITFYLVFIMVTVLFAGEKTLVIADLHFNPFYPVYTINDKEAKPGLTGDEQKIIKQLIESGIKSGTTDDLNDTAKGLHERWQKIFNAISDDKATGVPYKALTIGQNTDNKLFETMLADIAEKIKANDISCVLYMGDFFTHGFDDSKYNKNIVTYIIKKYDEKTLRDLKYSTMVYILYSIKKTIGPDKPIYMTLGNSDMYRRKIIDKKTVEKVNYSTGYTDDFKKDLKKIYTYFSTITDENWPGFVGSYTVDRGDDLQLISINTNYLSPKNPDFNEGTACLLMKKLHYELTKLSKNPDKKVRLLMHIPPGLQVPLFQPVDEWIESNLYWSAAAVKSFEKIYVKYSKQIEFSLTGHTHKSEFKFYTNSNGDPIDVTLINPGVGMRSGNYPGYTILDTMDGTHITWKVYATSLQSNYSWGYEEYSTGEVKQNTAGIIEGIRMTYNIKKNQENEQTSISFMLTPYKLPLFDQWWTIYNLGSNGGIGIDGKTIEEDRIKNAIPEINGQRYAPELYWITSY